LRIAVRAGSSARIYGSGFALAAPLRVCWANWINSLATVCALFRFAEAGLGGRPLRWVKTEHLYPSLEALRPHKRRLGEILVASGYLKPHDLESAITIQRNGERLGEILVRLRLLTEDELYEALSLQQNLPAEIIDPRRVPRDTARALPLKLVRARNILPFRVRDGDLFLAATDLPTDGLQQELRKHTRLQARFQLVTPAVFERLVKELL
jgi:hypothetical protein